MKPEICFIVNGNLKIGYGHVSRTLILAKKFKLNGFRVTYIIPESSPFIKRIEEFSYPVLKVKSFKEEDLKTYLVNDNICIIDSVEEDYKILSYLANYTIFTVTITLFLFDLNSRFERLSFFPDFSIKDIVKSTNVNGEDFILYKGKDFFTFREEFTIDHKEINLIGSKVLISMGGSDPKSLTKKVLNAISNFRNKQITVILNDRSQTFKEVEEICKKNQIKLHSYVDNIADYIIDSDIVILNGGLTRYESTVLKTPFIAISIHEKQFNITSKVTEVTKAINLGVYNKINDNQIDNSINNLLSNYSLRNEISQRMNNTIVSNGVEKIYEIITREYFKIL